MDRKEGLKNDSLLIITIFRMFMRVQLLAIMLKEKNIKLYIKTAAIIFYLGK